METSNRLLGEGGTMNRFLAVIAVLMLVGLGFLGRNIYTLLNEHQLENTMRSHEKFAESQNDKFVVYVENYSVDYFDSLEEAVDFAKQNERSTVVKAGSRVTLWHNLPPFNVFLNGKAAFSEFYTFAEAVEFAKTAPTALIYHRLDNMLIWSSRDVLPSESRIENVPLILQNPELPRGCEVTSLAMLLNYKGVAVSKMTLAEQVAHDPTPLTRKNGQTFYGNPNKGFVGDMRNLSNNGFGVYHKPIHDLLQEYFPQSSLDLTGADFEDLLHFISNGTPVWVITNATYVPRPPSDFRTWFHDEGQITTTNWLHSVLMTGYDELYIYFNDPLGRVSYAEIENFKTAWEQMGRQAVTLSA